MSARQLPPSSDGPRMNTRKVAMTPRHAKTASPPMTPAGLVLRGNPARGPHLPRLANTRECKSGPFNRGARVVPRLLPGRQASTIISVVEQSTVLGL
eukprot:1188117-Prorocentrum_minimum.AAC.3